MNDIKLTEEESKIIEDMMKDNKANAAKDVVNNIETEEDLDAAILTAQRAMKKSLKMRTKSQLIEIIWQYAVNLSEMQNTAQELYEDLQKYKPVNADEPNKTNTPKESDA